MKWIVPQLSQQVFQIFCNKNISADGINIRISQNSDDAEQKSNGEMDLNDKLDLDIAEDQTGLRFQNINIPQGSIITKAYIQFTAANSNEEDSAGVDIFAENIANAKTFSQSKFNVTNREKTNASIDWLIPKWNEKGDASKAQRTPDISALVQEVINREGWSSGNSIAFILIINNNGDRDALTYDGNPGKSPLLHLEFSDKQTCDDLIHGKGFWENHPDYLSTILEIEHIYLGDTTVETVKQATSVLKNASAKDANDSLRAHLLTTILNLRNDADPKITGSDINDVVKYTISFLVSYPEPVKSGHHDEDNDGNHDDEDNDSNHDDRKEALALKDKLEDYNEKDDFSCPPTQLVESLTLTDLVATTKGTAHTETIPETLFLDDEVATTKGTAHTETIPETLFLDDEVATTKGTAHTETIPETLFLDDEVATTKGTAHTETIPETLFLDDEVATTKGTAHTETIPETLFLDDEVATTKGTA